MLDAEMLEQRSGALMMALRVRHSDEEICAAHVDELKKRISCTSGFSSFDVIRRNGGLGVDFYVVARFENAESLEAWRASPARHQLLAAIEPLSIVDVSRQHCAGSTVWFEPVVTMPSPPKAPPLWKRWLLSFIAVYPALIVLVIALAPLTEDLPEALRLLVVAFVLTGLTTAFIIPWLNRTLATWLRPSR